MSRKKKNTGIGGVSFSNRGRKGRGKKGLDRWSMGMGSLGEKAFKNSKSRGGIVAQAAMGWRARLTPAERLDEDQRIREELENDPRRIVEEMRDSRLSGVYGFVRKVANLIRSNKR